MGLQARYDPREDRMRLALHGAKGEAGRAYWLTRRQWLGMLQQLTVLVPDPGASSEPPQPPQRKPAPLGQPSEAVVAESVRVSRTASGLRIGFVAGSGSSACSIPDSGVERLRQMLQQQADRAGWDADAALQRLSAQSLAGALVRKVRSS